MKKKVSIIIPAYNVEKYVYRAIESSIKQIYKNVEIIVIDDGSTDKTWDVICNYKKNDKRIIAERQINKGVSSARNKGLSKATGDYVIFIDSDDWIDEKCVKLLLENMLKFGAYTLISSDCMYAYLLDDLINIESSKKNYIAENKYMNKEECMICFCNTQYRLSSASYKLFDLDLIKKYGLHFEEEISHGEDGLFVYNYLKHCNGMYYFIDALWFILDRPNSATTSKYNKKWLSAVKAAEMIVQDNKEKKLNKYFKLYSCARISAVLCSALNNYNEEIRSDVVYLRKKMRQYITGVFKEKRLKMIVLYILLAYLPIVFARRIVK